MNQNNPIINETNTLPEDDHNDEPDCCVSCNGSGEGMFDGTRCGSCKGTGHESIESEDDDFDIPDEPECPDNYQGDY